MENTDLPNTVTINLSELKYEEGDDLGDAISDYLSDTYGFCHKGFEYEVDDSSKTITVVNIDWDTEE